MTTKVPPNGGWGWVIVAAYALNNLSTIPIMQGIGLVFKDAFAVLGFSSTDTTVIINVNMAFGMVLGLINGPILRRFGYRKVAMLGCVIYTLGVTLTAFANTFTLILFSYGVLASLGQGLAMSAFSLAVNTYFTTKRNRAVGLAVTVMGLGSIVMPQVTSFLLSFYGHKGTLLLFGSYSFHSMVGATLLQPVKWHMKKVAPTEDTNAVATKNKEKDKSKGSKVDTSDDQSNLHDSTIELNHHQRKRKVTTSSIDHDVEVGSIYGYDAALPRKLSETIKKPTSEKSFDMVTYNPSSTTNLPGILVHEHPEYPWWSSGKSVDTIHLGSSIKIFDENSVYQPLMASRQTSETTKVNENGQRKDDKEFVQRMISTVSTERTDQQNDNKKENHKKSLLFRAFRRVVVFYDLDLLRDPIYVNIMIGMSVAIFAEINFSMLTPFILDSMGLPTTQVANVMSVIATVDLIIRCAAPYIGEYLRQPPRLMYFYSLILLIISRTLLIFVRGLTWIMLVGVGLGVAKGIRSVYMALVIPNHVPIQRLPDAAGIQMVVNGVILMSFGPVIGMIRDVTGNYSGCIVMINSVTLLTVTIWSLEMIVLRRRRARRNEETNCARVET